jgi:UDP-glucose 4-epimerase
MCREISGSQAEIITDEDRVRPSGSEVEVLLSDPSLARSVLGWAPEVSLEDGLRATSEWLAPRVDEASAGRYQR